MVAASAPAGAARFSSGLNRTTLHACAFAFFVHFKPSEPHLGGCPPPFAGRDARARPSRRLGCRPFASSRATRPTASPPAPRILLARPLTLFVPRPSDPLRRPSPVPYLADVKGFSNAQIANDIFPFYAYFAAPCYLAAAPFCASFGLKPFLVFGAACKLLVRAVLIWGESLAAMRLSQILFASGSAADLVVLAYVYASLDRDDEPPTNGQNSDIAAAYRTATGAVSAASLGGYMLAAETGQWALDAGASLSSLFYASFAFVAVGFLLALSLPRSPPNERSAAAATSSASAVDSSWAPRAPSSSLSKRARAFASASLERCYGSTALRVLSAFWALSAAHSGFLENYATNLFEAIDPAADANGHVTFFARGAMALAALAASRATDRVAESPWTYAFAAFAFAALALSAARASSLAAAAASYCLAVAAAQAGACAAYAQAALAMDALEAERELASASDEYESERGGTSGGASGAAGGVASSAASPSSSRASSSSHASLFAANGALGLVALAVLQAIVSASGAGVRATVGASGWAAVGTGAATVFAAGWRKATRGEWGLRAGGADVGGRRRGARVMLGPGAGLAGEGGDGGGDESADRGLLARGVGSLSGRAPYG